MNPAQGRAVERARSGQDPDAHWVTIDGHHVLIREAQAGQAQHKPRRPMSLSSNGLDFIKKHEAFRSKMYLDSAGNPTIGYGHKIGPGEDFSKGITEKQALELLRKDAQGAVDAVNRYVPVMLSQNQFDALASFTYNLGPQALRDSTLRAKIVEGKEIREHYFTDYHFAGGRPSRGLLNRRKDDYSLFSRRD
jgi:lysozyme